MQKPKGLTLCAYEFCGKKVDKLAALCPLPKALLFLKIN